MSRILQWVRNNRELTAVILINAVFLSFFFYYTYNTGIFKDDYGYMYTFSQDEKLVNDRIDSLAQVFESQYEHYHVMNGRAVTHTLLQISLMMGKGMFALLNSVFYFALSFGMYRLVHRGERHSPLLQIMMYLAPWCIFPEFGNVFLVQFMSVNYLWSMAIIITALCVFKRLFDGTDIFENRKAAGAAVMLPAGIICGWLSENGSAAMLFLVGCMGLYYLLARKKIPLWCFTGFGGMCLGFLFMLLAPGYSVRSGSYNEYSYVFQFMKISVYHVLPYYGFIAAVLAGLACLLWFRTENDVRKRLKFAGCAAAATAAVSVLCRVMPESVRSECYLLAVAGMTGVCVWLAVRAVRKNAEIFEFAAPCAFMLTGLVATYAMIASPTFETRSELQFVIFFSCGAGYIFSRLINEFSSMLERATEKADCSVCRAVDSLAGVFNSQKLKVLLFSAMAVYAVVSLSLAVPAVNYANEQFEAREAYIEQQKAQGNFDIVLPAFDIPENTHAGIYNMINNDQDYWINRATCWYYGIDSVTYEQQESVQ